MGRYYFGDVRGKFWFGIQSSDDASSFGVEPREAKWCGSRCGKENEEHYRELQEGCSPNCRLCEDEDCELLEPTSLQYEFEEDDLEAVEDVMAHLETELANLVGAEWQAFKAVWDVREEPDNESEGMWITDEAGDAITDLSCKFDKHHKSLFARFNLGTAILRCLRDNGACYFSADI